MVISTMNRADLTTWLLSLNMCVVQSTLFVVQITILAAGSKISDTVCRLANMAVTETYDNAAHFDITYGCFVWIAFLPTCIIPGIYAAWILSSETKTRFKNYFRFSYRKQRSQTSAASAEESQVCEVTEERRSSYFSDVTSFNGTHRNSEVVVRNRDL